MKERWNTSKKAIYNIGYHIIWCPKCRKKILLDIVEKRLKELLLKKSREIGVNIETMEVMPDHIHIFAKCRPTHSPSYVVQQLKGYTSKKLRDEFSWLYNNFPTLWTRSYYCVSIGHISEKTVKRYIMDQKKL